jgi:hypothetical protein
MMKTLLALICCLPVLAFAQAAPTDFPADAQPLAPEALKAAIAGKSFAAKPAQGPTLRVEYKANGWAFVETSTGFRDTGTWRVEGSTVCATWQRNPAGSGCGEARQKGEQLYVRRVTNNEVLALQAE